MEFESREHLIAEIASMYYKEKNTQDEIASRIGYSRSAISRLLDEAEKSGIVEISIRFPLERVSYLENQLRDLYNIENVLVAKHGKINQSQVLHLVGRLGALHVEQLIHENSTIDISWGTGVFEVVNSLSAHLMPGIKVIQIIGAAGGKSDPNVDGPELARLLADKYGATYVSLHVPLLVDKPTTRQVLLSENEIKETLQQALKADFALVGIGSVEPESSTSYIRAGYLSQAQIAAVKSQGAVGSICGYLYDLQGNILDNELNQRIVAVDLKKLLHSRCEVIGIATGDYKVPAVLGALRGNLVKTIVIDSSIAEKILNAED